MRLAQFIQTNMEQLFEDWEEATLEIAPQWKGEDGRALGHYARSMLEFISQDLVTAQTRDESARKAPGEGTACASGIDGEHGTHRLKQGLSMLQIVQELRSLRALVTRAWSDREGDLTAKDIDELVRFNEAIDQLIASSVFSFLSLKEQETRLIETMLKASLDQVAIFDPHGRYVFINKAMADLIDVTHRVHLSGSIGLTVFPDDGKDVDKLMHNADQAMYAAKVHGGQRVRAY